MLQAILLLMIIVIIDFSVLSIDVIALSAILLILSYKYERKPKYDYVVYIIVVLLSATSLFIDIDYIRSGLIGFSMINVVMFTGVIPNKWRVTKKLKTYRSVYSILGVIFIFPHAYFNLFVDQEINLFGVAALVIMLPLFITSFLSVKKEMNQKEWIKVQKAAYLVYLLLFVHLISVADWYGKIIYAIMMTLYINNKLVKEFHK